MRRAQPLFSLFALKHFKIASLSASTSFDRCLAVICQAIFLRNFDAWSRATGIYEKRHRRIELRHGICYELQCRHGTDVKCQRLQQKIIVGRRAKTWRLAADFWSDCRQVSGSFPPMSTVHCRGYQATTCQAACVHHEWLSPAFSPLFPKVFLALTRRGGLVKDLIG